MSYKVGVSLAQGDVLCAIRSMKLSHIYLGIDPICGLEDKYLLSHDLVPELHRKNIQVLKDIHVDSRNNIWMDSKVLGLVGRLDEDWDLFISNLYQENITLSANSDKMV